MQLYRLTRGGRVWCDLLLPLFPFSVRHSLTAELVEGWSAGGGGGNTSRAQRQYNVDLMIALQLSRLQLLRDLKMLSKDDDDSTDECDS